MIRKIVWAWQKMMGVRIMRSLLYAVAVANRNAHRPHKAAYLERHSSHPGDSMHPSRKECQILHGVVFWELGN